MQSGLQGCLLQIQAESQWPKASVLCLSGMSKYEQSMRFPAEIPSS